MKRNVINELHTKTLAELQKQVNELRAELAKARFEKRAGTGKANLRSLRDDLARASAVLTFRQAQPKQDELPTNKSDTK